VQGSHILGDTNELEGDLGVHFRGVVDPVLVVLIGTINRFATGDFLPFGAFLLGE
jgi:hypothetical protein